jgi:hypothetical protein
MSTQRDQLVGRDPIVGGQRYVFSMAADVTANRPVRARGG